MRKITTTTLAVLSLAVATPTLVAAPASAASSSCATQSKKLASAKKAAKKAKSKKAKAAAKKKVTSAQKALTTCKAKTNAPVVATPATIGPKDPLRIKLNLPAADAGYHYRLQFSAAWRTLTTRAQRVSLRTARTPQVRSRR